MIKTINSINNDINHFITKAGLPDEVIEVITRSIVLGQHGSVKGLQLGDTAPNFTLRDVAGEPVTLHDLLLKGPVVLSFNRGSWCPFCNLELQSMQSNLKEFKALGAEVVTVLPQKVEASKELMNNLQLDFPVLSDEKQEVIDAYRVKYQLTKEITNLYRDSFGVDLAKLNANGTWNLPVPATFVIDTDKTIKARHFSHDYMIRMEPRDILEALENLPSFTEEIEYMRSI